MGGRSLGLELLLIYFRISTYTLPSAPISTAVTTLKRGLRILHKLIIVNSLASLSERCEGNFQLGCTGRRLLVGERENGAPLPLPETPTLASAIDPLLGSSSAARTR
jgi:hypothetical protein